METNHSSIDEYLINIVHYLDSHNFFSVVKFASGCIGDRPAKTIELLNTHIKLLESDQDFSSLVYIAQYLLSTINFNLFETKDAAILGDFFDLKTESKAEAYVKTLALIGLVQEFFGMCASATTYTASDFSNIIETSPADSRLFMNIHLIHFFYHKGYKKNGLFSMYGNSDLNDAAKFEQTKNFAVGVDKKLEEIIDSGKFDDYLVEFYSRVAEVKKLDKSDVLEFLNCSVEVGSITVNPIVLRLEEIGFAEFVR